MAVGIRANTDSETLDIAPGGLFTHPDQVTSIDLSSVEGHLDDAVEAARAAKGWAVGDDNLPLTGYSTTNNSEYYSDQARMSESNAAMSASAADNSATAAAASASAAQTAEGNARSAATDAANSATAAANSATAAAGSASAAAGSATAAASSASAAANSASDAAESARMADSDATYINTQITEAERLAAEVRILKAEVDSDSDAIGRARVEIDSDVRAFDSDLAEARRILASIDSEAFGLNARIDSDQAALDSEKIIRANVDTELQRQLNKQSRTDSEDFNTIGGITTNLQRQLTHQSNIDSDLRNRIVDLEAFEDSDRSGLAAEVAARLLSDDSDALGIRRLGNRDSELQDEINDILHGHTRIINGEHFRSGYGIEFIRTDSDSDTVRVDSDVIASRRYVDSELAGLSTTLSGLSDVTLTNIADSEILQYDSSSSMWVNRAPVDMGARSLDDLTDVTITGTPTEYDLVAYADDGSSIWNNYTTTINASNQLTHIFGKRLQTPIQFEQFTFNLSNSGNQTLNWDQLPGTFTFNATNNSNFQSEYASHVSALSSNPTGQVGALVDNAESNFVATNSYTLNRDTTPASLANNTYDGRDVRTGEIASAGGTVTLTAQWATNLANTMDNSATYSWRAAPNPIVTSTAGAALNFDRVLTGYSVIVRYNNISNASTIQTHTITPATNDGNTLTDQTQGTNTTHNITGATIYHNSTVSGTVSGSLIRPSDVSVETLANRTLTRSGSWSDQPQTRYRHWFIDAANTVNTSTAVEALLGTLDNNGYPTADSGDNTGVNQWKGNLTFTSTAFPDVRHYTIIVPSEATFVDTALGFNVNPNFNGTLTLGHSGATVAYYWYIFATTAALAITAS